MAGGGVRGACSGFSCAPAHRLGAQRGADCGHHRQPHLALERRKSGRVRDTTEPSESVAPSSERNRFITRWNSVYRAPRIHTPYGSRSNVPLKEPTPSRASPCATNRRSALPASQTMRSSCWAIVAGSTKRSAGKASKTSGSMAGS